MLKPPNGATLDGAIKGRGRARSNAMSNYYDLLRRTVAPLPGLDQRIAAYNRARHALADRLRSVEPPLSEAVIKGQQESLETAIRRLEGDIAQSAAPAESAAPPPPPDITRWIGGGPSRVLLVVVGVCVALIFAAAGYTYWNGWTKTAPPSPQLASSRSVEFDDRRSDVVASAAGTPLPYIFMRQLVYYRTTHPAGTVIIDKAQRHLYLIRPNVVAVRYGIGVGHECLDAAGLLRVSQKTELPTWRSVQTVGLQQFVFQREANESSNPLGARGLYLGSDIHLIHGTNVPGSIGRTVWLGCFRLTNSDVIELYDRVAVGGRVVVLN